tara:strand:- start:565 stop:921 length:357 start_codon:yes stop_codon:yes gene_type:complete
MQDKITQENSEFFVKILFPAFLAVGVKIAIEMKKNKTRVTFFNILLSMIIGVGGAYLSSGYILKNCNDENIPILIALIAITSEKIGEFLIFKLNIDVFLTSIFDGFFMYMSNIFTQKK